MNLLIFEHKIESSHKASERERERKKVTMKICASHLDEYYIELFRIHSVTVVTVITIFIPFIHTFCLLWLNWLCLYMVDQWLELLQSNSSFGCFQSFIYIDWGDGIIHLHPKHLFNPQCVCVCALECHSALSVPIWSVNKRPKMLIGVPKAILHTLITMKIACKYVCRTLLVTVENIFNSIFISVLGSFLWLFLSFGLYILFDVMFMFVYSVDRPLLNMFCFRVPLLLFFFWGSGHFDHS